MYPATSAAPNGKVGRGGKMCVGGRRVGGRRVGGRRVGGMRVGGMRRVRVG